MIRFESAFLEGQKQKLLYPLISSNNFKNLNLMTCTNQLINFELFHYRAIIK